MTDNLADRALQRQAARLERSATRQQQGQAQAQATAFYRGQGQYSTLGAAGSYRPRGTVTSGGVPIGQSVPANGGLVGGMPAGYDDLTARVVALEQRLAAVAQERGPQIANGNPTDNNAAPRYPQDFYYDQATGNLWQWQPGEADAAGEWALVSGILEQIDVAIDVPANRDYVTTYSQRYPVKIVALHAPAASYTITLSPAPGSTLALGSSITLTLSGIPDGESDPPQPPLSVTIETRRVG